MALDAIRGLLCVIMPLIIQRRLPTLTRYFTKSARRASIPPALNIVAIQPINSIIVISKFGTLRVKGALVRVSPFVKLRQTSAIVIPFTFPRIVHNRMGRSIAAPFGRIHRFRLHRYLHTRSVDIHRSGS